MLRLPPYGYKRAHARVVAVIIIHLMMKIACMRFALAGVVAAAFGVQAAPMNKCVSNGAVTYQQGPCPATQPRKDPTLEELNAAEKKRRAAAASAAPAPVAAPTATAAPNGFSCDGRTFCSQMKSCDEAKYFLAHCPGVKMDGDRNGIPCEKQWCSR